MILLTFGVNAPTSRGATIPETEPDPFTIAMMVPAKLGLKSRELTRRLE